jgi:hypothetical protein
MSVWVAHHRKVTDNTAHIHRRFNQNVLLSRQLGNPVDLFARVALKPEVIDTRLNLILDDDQNENRIATGLSGRAEPNIVAAFWPAIPHNRKTAERSVELN